MQDLGELTGDLRVLKALVASRIRAFPPEWPGEAVRFLRETNFLKEERFAQLDAAIREERLEIPTWLWALADSQRQLVEGQRALSEDIPALIARLDALTKGRGGGSPSR